MYCIGIINYVQVYFYTFPRMHPFYGASPLYRNYYFKNIISKNVESVATL